MNKLCSVSLLSVFIAAGAIASPELTIIQGNGTVWIRGINHVTETGDAATFALGGDDYRLWGWTRSSGSFRSLASDIPYTPRCSSEDGRFVVIDYPHGGGEEIWDTVANVLAPTSNGPGALCMSADGSVTAGWHLQNTNTHASVRTNGVVSASLPPNGYRGSFISAMSRTGDIVAGSYHPQLSSSDPVRPFIWHIGQDPVMIPSPIANRSMMPYSMSPDGRSLILGDWVTSTYNIRFFRWTAGGGSVPLTTLEGNPSAGTITWDRWGRLALSSAAQPGTIWRQGLGQMSAITYLTQRGVSFGRLNSPVVRCMSPDGRTFAGWALSSATPVAWIATNVPGSCPADFNGDGFADFFDYDGYVQSFESGDASADANGDGFLDFFDYDEFVVQFEAGC